MDWRSPTARSGVLIAVVVAVVIVLVLVIETRIGRYERYLEGFWEAPAGWAAEAGVDAAYLSIGPAIGGGGEPWNSLRGRISWTTRHAGYLVMTRDGETVYNGPIELEYSSWVSRYWSALWSPTARYSVRAATVDTGESDGTALDPDRVLPAELDLDLSLNDGSLALSTPDTVWGFFYKNHEGSVAGSLAAEAAEQDAGMK